MSRRRPGRDRRRGHAVGPLAALLAGLLAALLLAPVATGAGLPFAAGAAATSEPTPITSTVAPAPVVAVPSVTILGVTPRLPDATNPGQKIRIKVLVSNATTQTFTGLSLRIRRGYPIDTESGLQEAITTPPPTDNVVLASHAIAGRLGPGQQRTAVLGTTVGPDGVCLCSPGPSVYPLDVVLDTGSTGIELARAHTFMPSFPAGPAPVKVSWVWPLLDRPHRATSDSVFIDDALAAEVSPGGRLYRALQVASMVEAKVRLTLLIDPDLIDSLSAMTRGYTVRTKTGSRPGTGKAAATAWLAHLKAVAAHVDTTLTAYADPDVDALADAGIAVPAALDPQVGARVRAVLGPNLHSDLAWPADGALDGRGLDQVIGNGASAVLLSDKSLRPPPGATAAASTPDAVSPLPSANGTATAFVLSTALEKTVDAVTSPSGTGADTQLLLAQLAIRAAQDPAVSHYVVLAPARYVDPAPAQAAAAMLAVAAAPWAQGLSVRAAEATISRVDRGTLRPAPAADGLSRKLVTTLVTVSGRVAALRGCLRNDDAATLLGGYSPALARAGSTAWRSQRAAGLLYIDTLRTSIDKLTSGIRIVSPANASYTLASADAPLFVTVQNQLDVPVQFRVQVTAAEGEQGLRADTVPIQTIEAADGDRPTRQQVKVPTHVARTGRFQIRVTLLTPTGLPLGKSLPLRVRSTALGRAALWITGIAFAVLIAALAIRGVRQLRALRRRATSRARARPALR